MFWVMLATAVRIWWSVWDLGVLGHFRRAFPGVTCSGSLNLERFDIGSGGTCSGTLIYPSDAGSFGRTGTCTSSSKAKPSMDLREDITNTDWKSKSHQSSEEDVKLSVLEDACTSSYRAEWERNSMFKKRGTKFGSILSYRWEYLMSIGNS